MEDIAHGERIRAYKIEGRVGDDDWQILCSGKSVGLKRIETFDPAAVSEIRLRITHSIAEPHIKALSAYSII
jgi:hypothetical protein